MATTNATGSRRSKELDKFKRRMIRAVARLMLHEKMPENEMWEKLKTETGYDCELLWGRMRSVALKKLKRMLIAEDRVDAIARMARMTVTDWLLFDLVLVHDKTDFIGTDAPRMKQGELKPLTDLFSLVQKYGIEGLSGDALAKAWTDATLFYNSQGHHVSPMLLQKRWYQLKETTRNCFYQFWFSYRGNAKLFAKASTEYMPTMLQIAIARRFNEVVTSQFIEWEDMIQKGFVILSEEFDARLRPPKKQIDDNAPDIVLVEPVIETIDLEAESDTEAGESKQNSAENSKPALKTVVKTEPVDIDEDLEAAENLMQTFTPHDDEDTFDSEFADTDDLDIEDSTLASLDNALENDESVPSLAPADKNTITDELNNAVSTTNDETVASPDLEAENIITLPAGDESLHIKKETLPLDNGDITSRTNANKTECFEILPAKEMTESIETLPQISSVFGNVHLSSGVPAMNAVSTEINSMKCSSSDDDVELITANDDIAVKKETSATEDTLEIQETVLEERPGVEGNLQKNPIARNNEDKVMALSVDDIINKTCEKALEKLIDKSITGTAALDSVVKSEVSASSYGEIPNYHNLVDDGIELVDDGIAYVDEEMDYRNEMDGIKTEGVEEEDESEADNAEEPTEDAAKIDLKLLLYPVVYTTRLDNMGVLDDAYQTVKNQNVLDIILDKSKPISKQTVNFDDIKKENENTPSSESMSDEDDANENIITNENRVKLSSYLLQKPRTRNYNPIILCRNPDFNTRLKRLNVGFYGSMRNINLLKDCKPLTVDLSKAFESKLINGTIYLKPNDDVRRVAEATENERRQQTSTVPTAMSAQSLIDNNQKVNPIFTEPPSAVFSKANDDILIVERNKVINLPDISQVRRLNQRLLTAEVSPIQMCNNLVTPPTAASGCVDAHNTTSFHDTTAAHNKTSETLTTKVVEDEENSVLANNGMTKIIEVEEESVILNKDMNIIVEVDENNLPLNSGMNKNTSNASNVMIKEVNINVEELSECVTAVANTAQTPYPSSHCNKRPRPWNPVNDPKKKPTPWKSREIRPSVSWLSMSKHVYPPADDVLLTIDTLNKMLFLLTQEKDERDVIMQKKAKEITRKSNKALAKKKGRPKKQQSDQSTQICMDDASNDEVLFIPTTDKEKSSEENQSKDMQPEDNEPKDKKNCKLKVRAGLSKYKRQYCCWSQEKIQALHVGKRTKPHECLVLPCKCCCSEELRNFMLTRRLNRRLEQACQSIETVVQQAYSDENEIKKNPTNFTFTNTNKPFRVEVVDLKSSDSTVKATESKEVPPPSIEAYIDNVSGEDAPPVGAEVSVSSSVKSPKVNIQIAKKSYDATKLLKQPLGSTARVVSTSIPKAPFQKFQYISNRCLSPTLPSAANSYQKTMETSSTSCRCVVPISVDSPHRKIVIDGSSTCPIHKSILPKTSLNDNQIFLTSRQISRKPAQSPIFLGKNKILLTNVRFPSDLAGEAVVAPQAPVVKIIPTLPLPTGVQLVLRPSGELTYKVDPNIQLDPEKLEGLPEILHAVKQQLNCMDISSANRVTNNASMTQNNDVVTLSDDETSEQSNKDNEESQSIISHTEKDNVSNDIPCTSNAPTASKEICDNITQHKQDANYTETQKTVELTKDANVTEKQNTSKTILDVRTEDDKDGSKDQQTEKDIESNNQTMTAEKNSESGSNDKDSGASETVDSNNEIAQENNDSSKSKNILSDLMEMSGISAEDVTSATTVTDQPEAQVIQPLLKQFLDLQSVEGAPQAPQTDVTKNVPASLSQFSPIMSFAELKYACLHNGLFFKLDFETGSIIPINVCIKKSGETKVPKTNVPASVTIDLTDDNVSEKKSKPQNQSAARSLLIASQKSKVLNRLGVAKPLKLFKSVHPSVLSDPNEPNVYVVKNLESFKNIPKLKALRLGLKRKDLEKVDAKIDMVDSDCPMEEEYLESSGSDGETRKRNAESDESSDEEPLSKVAKRIRAVNNDELTPEKSNTPAETGDDQEKDNLSAPFEDQSEEEDGDDCILGV